MARLPQVSSALADSSGVVAVTLDSSYGMLASGQVRVGGAGAAVGPYRLEAVLGRGGMGVVYRGEHTLLRRERAIKLLSRQVHREDATAAPRFLREAQMAAQVRDPRVVDVCDVGHARDGRPYLAMELADGQRLDEALARGPLPPVQAVALGRELAAAMRAVHDAGVVHRDVTPRNLLVSDEGALKLIDFGAATSLRDGGDAVLDTPVGQVIGTPAYMSPEQATAQGCDERSDLYQVGVVLFQMITGTLPFWADTAQDLMRHHVHTLPPTVGSPLDVVPAGLVACVARLLEKEPALRHQCAGELDDDLARVQRQLARPAWRALLSR